MWAKLWKASVRASVVLLLLIVVFEVIGRSVPHHMVRVASSATSETYVTVRFYGVGYARIIDPTGYAIPYRERMGQVVAPDARAVTTKSFRIPYLFDAVRGGWINRQGGRFESFWWRVVLLPFDVLAALIVIVQ